MRTMTELDRFLAMMEYQPLDRLPNWECGAWAQTVERWIREGLDGALSYWSGLRWFYGEPKLGLDRREYIPFHGGMIPGFQRETLQEDAETELFRDERGRVRRALKTGAVGEMRMSMDTYVRFPVETMGDWRELKKRYDPSHPRRLGPDFPKDVPTWKMRDYPLILGPTCSTPGFYWMAREWMGTEKLSLAWYDQPELMHDMMRFWGDFLIEATRPALAEISVEYICLNEDLAMKTGPLLSPETYRTYILPHFKRVVEFFKGHGVRYMCVDTDGNPEPIIPMLLDAGLDILWPLERAAGQDPPRLRQKFGKSLHLWGGVDKREVAKGPAAIDSHLRSLAPLVEEGGFVPHINHTVPPDISWVNFQYYLQRKDQLLRMGRL